MCLFFLGDEAFIKELLGIGVGDNELETSRDMYVVGVAMHELEGLGAEAMSDMVVDI